jgi:hypothetical protein
VNPLRIMWTIARTSSGPRRGLAVSGNVKEGVWGDEFHSNGWGWEHTYFRGPEFSIAALGRSGF